MKKIMVTGASGFVGSALVKQLREHGYEVIEITTTYCDLRDPSSLSVLSRVECDFVFHVAGKTGVPSSWGAPLHFYQSNVDTTRHVLEYCRQHRTPMHYVSAYVYGVTEALPIHEGIQPNPNNPYAHSKWMAEKLCEFYHHQYHVPLTISRPFNIYGPNQPSDMFIPTVLNQMKQGECITVGDLSPARDYVFIEDVVNALIAIMEKGKEGDIYNIGTGKSHTCLAVIELLQSLMKTNKPVQSQKPPRPNEMMDVHADISKIHAQTGWSPAFSLYDGLSTMVSA